MRGAPNKWQHRMERRLENCPQLIERAGFTNGKINIAASKQFDNISVYLYPGMVNTVGSFIAGMCHNKLDNNVHAGERRP